MSDDVCGCGICEIETCDVCGRPSWRIDDYNESWCRRCWEQAQEPSADWLDRQIGLEPMSASEEARYYQRMKGGQTGW